MFRNRENFEKVRKQKMCTSDLLPVVNIILSMSVLFSLIIYETVIVKFEFYYQFSFWFCLWNWNKVYVNCIFLISTVLFLLQIHPPCPQMAFVSWKN